MQTSQPSRLRKASMASTAGVITSLVSRGERELKAANAMAILLLSHRGIKFVFRFEATILTL